VPDLKLVDCVSTSSGPYASRGGHAYNDRAHSDERSAQKLDGSIGTVGKITGSHDDIERPLGQGPLPLPPSILFDDLDMEDLLAFTLEKRLVANLNQAL